MKKMMAKYVLLAMALAMIANCGGALAEGDVAVAQPMEIKQEAPKAEAMEAPEATEVPEASGEAAPVEEQTEVASEYMDEDFETPVSFSAEVEIRLVGDGDVCYGDRVILRTVIKNASADYSIQWERSNDGGGWEKIDGENGKEYEFVVTEESAHAVYRVALAPDA